MKKASATNLKDAAGFTLIEMIGVMAVLAILAAMVVPNALHSIDRAAVVAEGQTLHNFGEQTKVFLRAYGKGPGRVSANTWSQDLAQYTDIGANGVLTNKRQLARMFIYEPVAAPKRILILSCMHAGLTLPTAAQLNSVGLFDNVWNTPDGTIPPASPAPSWGGWAAWRTALNGLAGDYLVIERVNLNSEYATVDWSMNNTSATDDVSCVVTWADGSTPTTYSITKTPNTSLSTALNTLSKLHVRDKVSFYSSARPGVVLFSYVASDGPRTFTYTTTWVAQ